MKSFKVSTYNLFFFCTIIGIYFINNNRYDPTIDLMRKVIVGAFGALFIIILGAKTLLNQIRVSKLHFFYSILIIAISIIAYINSGYLMVNAAFIIAALYIVSVGDKMELSIKKKYGVAIFISILLQMLFFRSSGRPVLSYMDPNYSSMYLMLAFMFSWKIRQKKIALFLLGLGLLMLSRNFVLSILVFFITLSSERLRVILTKISFPVLFIFSYILLFIVGAVFISTIDSTTAAENYNETQNNSARLTVYGDMSNLNRFMANVLFIKDITENPSEYFWGTTLENYTNNVFKNTPHNFLFLLIVGHGIFFSLIYLLMLFNVFSSKIYSDYNIPYILSFMPYILLLGGGFSGITLLFLVFILNINEKKSGVAEIKTIKYD